MKITIMGTKENISPLKNVSKYISGVFNERENVEENIFTKEIFTATHNFQQLAYEVTNFIADNLGEKFSFCNMYDELSRDHRYYPIVIEGSNKKNTEFLILLDEETIPIFFVDIGIIIEYKSVREEVKVEELKFVQSKRTYSITTNFIKKSRNFKYSGAFSEAELFELLLNIAPASEVYSKWLIEDKNYYMKLNTFVKQVASKSNTEENTTRMTIDGDTSTVTFIVHSVC